MTTRARLRDAFLVCDTNKTGQLDETQVLRALLSLGFVVSHEQRKKVKSMNLDQFVDFGENLTKSNNPETELSNLIKNLSGGKGNLGTVEFEQVLGALTACDPNEVKQLVQVLDPKGSGHFDAKALAQAFAT